MMQQHGKRNWLMATAVLTTLFASQSAPPALFNTAFYSSPKVDQDLAAALKTTSREEKSRLYKDAQDTLWANAPWIFLATEKLGYARNKNLSDFYVMPDGSFEFSHADMK